MKAMIMAAGLGTRLRPLTDNIPKALVKYKEKTLLEHAIEHLKNNGADKFIVNVHHFADKMKSFISQNLNQYDITVSDESDELLDTGGGLKKAAWFFDDGKPFIVRNVDVISDLDISKMNEYHLENGALATLAVRNRETSRYFLFDDKMKLCGWTNTRDNRVISVGKPDSEPVKMAFSGIQILNPDIFALITETGKFSLTEMYLRLAAENPIMAYTEPNMIWRDLGKLNDLNS